jgi:Zn-dependent M16 (insulinase) family peptidase
MQSTPSSAPAGHPAFEFLARQRIDSLNIDVQEYRHRATGARHFHLASEDTNNAFLVAFLTVPQDSTGVAHILEHTSLCGSRHYPVRDPFFMMIRRSLNTFMNAFTSSDWTAYPFASQNPKDFYNLLDVYLDATFFPRLDPLDFSQEGHRVEFRTADDPTTPLVYKGVVYNEMKGAMSAPVSEVWQQLHAQVFPTITYHYNSGGDPMEIPRLTHRQLKDFHARHYHPSNAVFMTYGNLPVQEHQARFEDRALSRFEALSLNLGVPDEQRFQTPRTVEERYALEEQDLKEKTHIVMGWLWGKTIDPRAYLTAHLLSGVLLDNGASPLRHALETTDLGSAPSELCGLDDSTREMVFVCGLEGSEPERAQQAEELILGVLGEVAERGLPQPQVESVLHQLELHQREIQGGGFPYGLRLMVHALGPILHGGDPVRTLDIDPLLEELRIAIRDPEYIKGLVRELLLDNPHRVRLTMAPDAELNQRREALERERLDAMQAAMGEEEKARVVDLAQRLAQRQRQEDDPEVLPKVGREDIPAELEIPEGEELRVAELPAVWYSRGTNGMVYEQVVAQLPSLSDEQLELLPLLCECLGEVGSGGRDYLDTQALQAAVTGGIGARLSVRSRIDDTSRGRGLFVVSGKALTRNQGALAELLKETFEQPRFDESARLRELIAQSRASREMAVTHHGHALAMTAACAGMSPLGALSHRWDGLLGLQRLKTLDRQLDDAGALETFGERLARTCQALTETERRLLLVGEAQRRDTIVSGFEDAWLAAPAAAERPNGAFAPGIEPYRVREAWVASTQVNFCAKAYPCVPQAHPDAAALTVLGGFLRNGFLHRTVREQGGAYGAGASYDADTAAFRFSSYRDPRLTETLEDFDRSIDWLLSTDHPERTLEEAVLGVIAAIDRPSSPAGEAIATYFSSLHGRTPEQRRAFRARILEVSLEDLKRVGERYLRPEQASIAVLTNAQALRTREMPALTVHRL